MLKQTILLSALTTSMLASFAAQAADTAELAVKGVIRPVSCSLSLGNGGIVHYGTIDATQIPASQATVLETKTVPFAVTCGAPIPIGLRLIDNQANSVVPGLSGNLNPPAPDLEAYGLGSVNGKNIGIYAVQLEHGSVQGLFAGSLTNLHVLSTEHSLNSYGWISNRSAATNFHANGLRSWKAFTLPAWNTPSAFSSYAGKLSVTAVLDHGTNLPLEQEISLNGSATLEIMYL